MRFGRPLAAFFILTLFTACADKAADKTADNPQNQMQIDTQTSQTNSSAFDIKYKKLPSTEDNNCPRSCPQIQYQLITTPYAWLDGVMNKAVLQLLDVGEMTDSSDAQAAAIYTKPTPSDDEFSHELSRIKQNLDKLAKDMPSDEPIFVRAEVKFLGVYQNLPQFSVQSESFLGGAHGMANQFYYVFDLDKQRKLSLTDVVIANQMSALKQTLKTQFNQLLESQGVEPAQHWQFWQFEVSDNFIFSDDGMEFLYQPYQIAPYAQGFVRLSLTKAQMQKFIKPQFIKS